MICVSIIFFGTISIGNTKAVCDRSLDDEQGISYFEFSYKKNGNLYFAKKYYGYHRNGGSICSNEDWYTSHGDYKQISKDEYCDTSNFSKHKKYLGDWKHLLNQSKRICSPLSTEVSETDLIKIASDITNKDVCQRATKSDGSSFEHPSSAYGYYVKEAKRRGFNLETCNQLTGRGNNQTVTQTAQIPSTTYGKDFFDNNSFCLRYGQLNRIPADRGINEQSDLGVFCDEKDIIISDFSKLDDYCLTALNDYYCNKFKDRYKTNSNQTVTQTVQVPKTKVDKTAPVLDVEDRILVNQIDYSISGQVSDESKVFIEVNGNSINIVNNTFKIEGSTPIGLNEVEIVAFDEWGNKTSKKIIIDRVLETADSLYQFEDLNPYKLKSKTNKNKLALVIGIETYESIPNANFADRDAKFFIDYVQRGLGVPENKIKFFFNEDAKERSKFEMVKWLKKNINSKSEVYLYFSGHGLATNKGQDLYLLANDTITDFIEETAINRNEIFNAVAANNPKSVTAFLDTCYSGAGRTEGETLLAMAKGLVVVDEQQQQLPDNFTLFTAASAQESAWSLPEAQHGTFSYFLMKGMEGEADLNDDNKLTNGELQEYLLDNVSRYAQQQQTPQMIGDPDQVLVRF